MIFLVFRELFEDSNNIIIPLVRKQLRAMVDTLSDREYRFAFP